MSYQSLQSELRNALSRSMSELIIKKNRDLVEAIQSNGIDPHLICDILGLFKELSEAYLTDLKNYQSALRSALSEADSFCSDEKSNARNRRDKDVAAVERDWKEKLSKLTKLQREYEEALGQTQEEIEKQTSVYNSYNWLDKKLYGNDRLSAIEELKKTAATYQLKLTQVLSGKEAGDKFRREQTEKHNAEYSKRSGDVQTKCHEVQQECKKMEGERRDSLTNTVAQFLERLIPQSLMDEYLSRVESMRPNYREYSPINIESFNNPGEFYLGFARWKTPKNKLLDNINCRYISTVQNTTIVALPYVVNLTAGLQLLIRPTGASDAFWDNDCVHALTIRLLMAYPPGKLQLTLIDSFKIGRSFAGIPDIVDKHHENIISGGVLTEAEYIAQALKSLRTKMGNYSGNQGYGSDKQSYFDREPIQAVIINDFPNGFTAASLADLARLMENGEAFGMIFIIGMNPTFEPEFANSADYKAILSRSEMIKLSGDDPIDLSLNDTPFELILADENEVIDNKESIIRALHEGVIVSKTRKEHFSQLFSNPNDWQNENSWRHSTSMNGVMIPIGVSGASKIFQINVGMPGANTLHHGLIAGPTGAGKSTALHTMIMSILLNYSPDEVQLVLIDFKEGTEFRSYAPYRIPNFRSITTTTEPEFALAALEDVKALYEDRATKMSDYFDYRRDNDEDVPQVLVFFDEIQALFADGVRGDIKAKCAEILTLLVTKARAMGIHVFLASQNFERVSCVQPLKSDMKIRLVLKDADTGGILDDASALRDASAGSAILNNQGGVADKNDLFQVCMLDDDERDGLLNKLSNIYSAPGMAERYRSFNPRLLFTNIEDDLHHPFNLFIDSGIRPPVDEVIPTLRVGSLLKVEGNSQPYRDTGHPFNIQLDGENLLLIGDNSSVAKSVFIFSMLSIGLDSLSRRAEFEDEVVLFDFTEGGMYSDREDDELSGDATLEAVYGSFPGLIKHVPTGGKSRRSRRSRADALADGKPPMESEIDRVHKLLLNRMDKCKQSDNPDDLAFSRVFLFAFAINSALRLANADSQEGGMYGELSALAKLQEIMTDGALYDIYTIAWGQTIDSTEKILNFNSFRPVGSYFKNRIVFSAKDSEFQSLAACVSRPATKEGAAFCNLDSNDRIYFRPFDTPKLGWIEDFRCRFEDSLGF